MCLNRPTHGRNYSGEQKVNFESPVPFSKCLRAKIYSNMNVYYDPKRLPNSTIKGERTSSFYFGLLDYDAIIPHFYSFCRIKTMSG